MTVIYLLYTIVSLYQLSIIFPLTFHYSFNSFIVVLLKFYYTSLHQDLNDICKDITGYLFYF